MAAPNCAGERVGLRAPVWWSSPPGATSHATTATAQQPATRLPSAPGETELSSPLSLSFSLSPPPLRRGLSLSLAHSSSLPLSLNSSLSALSLLLSPNFSLEFCVLPLFFYFSYLWQLSETTHTRTHRDRPPGVSPLCDKWGYVRAVAVLRLHWWTDRQLFFFFFFLKKRKERKERKKGASWYIKRMSQTRSIDSYFLFFTLRHPFRDHNCC